MPIDNDREIQLLLDKLRQDFLSGLADRADEMERQLLELEKQPQQRAALAELFRLFHSLKGTAGSYGLHVLAKVCHQFENLLQAFGAGQLPLHELVQNGLRYIDYIRAVEGFAADIDETQLEQAAAVLPGLTAGPRKKLLVCDKSRVVRESVQMALAGNNLEFKFTDSGITALETIIREPVDLLITARQLNELSGAAVIAALRVAESPYLSLPVIMMVNRVAETPSDLKLRLVQRNENFVSSLADAVRALLGD